MWKSADKAAEAAEAMGITSQRLKDLGLIDVRIPEPLGGAHRDIDSMARTLSTSLQEILKNLDTLPIDELLEQRYQRVMQFGIFETA